MRHDLPVGPSDPSLIQLGRYLADPVGYLERCRERYGPVFTLRWPGMPPMVYFGALGAIREIFASPTDVLCAGQSNAVLDFVAGPRSVARLDGAAHRERRQALVRPFMRLDGYADTMVRQTVATLDDLPDGPVDFRTVSQSLSLRNLITCTLGVEDPSQVDRLHDLMVVYMHDSLNPVMALAWVALPGVPLRHRLVRHLAPLARQRYLRHLPFVRLADTIAELDQELYRLISADRRRRGDGATDVLSILVNQPEQLTDDDLRDEMMALLVAGHETTSTTMDWFVLEVLRRPEVHRRLLDELDSELGSRAVTPADLPNLPYLSATITECLRLHAPIPSTGRHVAVPTTIAGVHLPAGVVVSPALAVSQRDPSVWDDPTAFDPQRHLDGTTSKVAQLAFGGGARTCVGKHFALFQLQIVLATLLTRFDLVPEPWGQTKQVQRGIFTGVSHPLDLTVRARQAVR